MTAISHYQRFYFLIAQRNDTRSHDYHMMRLLTRGMCLKLLDL